MTIRNGTVLGTTALLLGASACAVSTVDEGTGSESDALLVSSGTTSEPLFCAEPPEVEEGPEDLTVPSAPDLGSWATAEGLAVSFDGPGRPTNEVDRLVGFEEEDPRGTLTSITGTYAGWRVVVQTGRVYRRTVDRTVWLSTGGRPIRDVDLKISYETRTARDGSGAIMLKSLAVLPAGGGTGGDTWHPDVGLADPPSDCKEEGIIAFGPFPFGMPPVKIPSIHDCNGERCRRLTLAWLRLHHNIWRAAQMFEVMEPMHPEQRLYFWSQPGTDAAGDPLGERTSPAYWFGPYDGDRYEAVREVIFEYFGNVLHARVGSESLKLRCPDYDENPGNWCFTHQPLAHHVVKGWVDFCSGSWNTPTCNGGQPEDTVDKIMHHEPLHHVWTHLHGTNRMLKDGFSHQHGSYCGTPLGVDYFYCEDGNDGNNIRHLVTWSDPDTGTRCDHLDQDVRAVEAYALFVRTIGEMVHSGEMTHWPKLADPTPTPPSCSGEVGCQCEDTGGYLDPDGDYSDHTYCPDNEDDGAPTVCMKTKFNASDTVGICTHCTEFRGPGCPCNDYDAPCDSGFCWGDDTQAAYAGVGTCYQDPPPTWGCLADCEMLLGSSAFCMWDHPDHARCVPGGTTLPEASSCWSDGGHMDPNTLSCDYGPECIDSQDCWDLGYPSYFTCDSSVRCVPSP